MNELPKREGDAPVEEQRYVLCVDDEENILKALKRLFYGEPFRVLTATSGKDALEMLRNNRRIGLILSDQRMPEMSGAAFLEAARVVAPLVPRMILTGYADIQAATDAVNQGGAYRLLAKPWNDQLLLQAVRDGLSGNIPAVSDSLSAEKEAIPHE